jgi:hypothetical protein
MLRTGKSTMLLIGKSTNYINGNIQGRKLLVKTRGYKRSYFKKDPAALDRTPVLRISLQQIRISILGSGSEWLHLIPSGPRITQKPTENLRFQPDLIMQSPEVTLAARPAMSFLCQMFGLETL